VHILSEITTCRGKRREAGSNLYLLSLVVILDNILLARFRIL